MEKKRPWYSARFWVWAFFTFQVIAIILSVIPSILNAFNVKLETYSVPFDTELIGWFWMTIIVGYTGSQAVEHIFISRNLEIGEYDTGDLSKMRKMIAATYALLVCVYLVDVLFNAGLETASYIASAGASTLVYTIGTKAVKTAGEVTTKTEEK